jgi:hypothetical protein
MKNRSIAMIIRYLSVLFIGGLFTLPVFGCGGSTLQAPPPAATATPTTQRILFVRGPVPSSVAYTVLGPLAVRKLSYGGPEWALQRLADEARTAGANAVLDVEITFAPSWGGWATPHGKGTAVRITSPTIEEVANMPELKTEWW